MNPHPLFVDSLNRDIEPADRTNAPDPFNPTAVDEWRRQQGIDPQRIRKFRNAWMKQGRDAEFVADRWPELAPLCRQSLRLESRHDSQQDGATKLLFRTESGSLVESVILRIATGRTTLCVSSQVGCAAACQFCATGKMGLTRNLSVSEILQQVVQANQLLRTEQRSIRNVVFMGMGEPFHNAEAVSEAVDRLRCPRHFALSGRHIMVSTVGIPAQVRAFAARFPDVNLAVSLHSVDPAVRAELIPLAHRHTLPELHAAIREFNTLTGRHVMLEYLLLREVNDQPKDAAELVAWCAGLDVHVNLIPFNPIEGAPHLVGSEPAQQQRFAETVKAAGVPTTIRYSLGGDIAAACGQLVRQREKSN